MPRMARVVVPGVPHHVTQRGTRRQTTFFSASDYETYLRTASREFAAAKVQVWAYCLMPNHVHLIATPETADGLAQAVGATHVRYARHINNREGWTGHLWQDRFASFPMDGSHLGLCARYVGLNPVRAGLTARAVDWPWSSVQAHVAGRPDALLSSGSLADRLGVDLAGFFDLDIGQGERRLMQGATRSGRPLGSAAWVKTLGLVDR
jgi:putative transposase